MCWVGLDRGIRIVENTSHSGPTSRWRDHCDRIEERVLREGYDDSLGSFVRSFEEDDLLDATSLLIPITGFLPFEDDRVQGTIDATLDRLVDGNGLVERYEGRNGLPGEEGAFLLCSFWLVDALALSGRTDEALEIFEDVIEYANPLGLFSEEVEPSTGAHLGNTPQAFSHIGLINSVLYLESVLGDEVPEPLPRGAEVSNEIESGSVRDQDS